MQSFGKVYEIWKSSAKVARNDPPLWLISTWAGLFSAWEYYPSIIISGVFFELLTLAESMGFYISMRLSIWGFNSNWGLAVERQKSEFLLHLCSWGLNFCASIDLGFQLLLNLGLGCGNSKVGVYTSFYMHGFWNYQLGISTLSGVWCLVLEIQKSEFDVVGFWNSARLSI